MGPEIRQPAALTQPFRSLADSTVVITGGGGGIGAGLSQALVDFGARVCSLDLADQPLATMSLECDVADAKAVRQAITHAEHELGAISGLVCAAGVVTEHPLTELPPAEWRRVVEVSLNGTFHALQAVLPSMLERSEGSVVALSSGWARRGYPNGAHYAAAKAGVEGTVRSAALEVAARGVRVNAVSPGPVETAMLDRLTGEDENRAVDRARAVPMGRIGQVEDIVGPVLFLLGDGSRYLTGQVLQVNGGLFLA